MIQSLRKSLRQVFLLILYDDAKQVELKMLKVTHCKKRKKKIKDQHKRKKKTHTNTKSAKCESKSGRKDPEQGMRAEKKTPQNSLSSGHGMGQTSKVHSHLR